MKEKKSESAVGQIVTRDTADSAAFFTSHLSLHVLMQSIHRAQCGRVLTGLFHSPNLPRSLKAIFDAGEQRFSVTKTTFGDNEPVFRQLARESRLKIPGGFLMELNRI